MAAVFHILIQTSTCPRIYHRRNQWAAKEYSDWLSRLFWAEMERKWCERKWERKWGGSGNGVRLD